MRNRIRNRLERLEEVAATTVRPKRGTRLIRRVVDADGTYTGEEQHYEAGEWRQVFNPDTAGTRAPGTRAPDVA